MTRFGVQQDWLLSARRVVQSQREALAALEDRLDENFVQAVRMIVETNGNLIVSGVGKSGIVARKIAASFCSVGQPAVFLHPTEALHGDVGVCRAGDAAILLSNSGWSEELLQLAPVLRRNRLPIVGIIGNVASPLAAECSLVLDVSIPANDELIPLASTLAAMSMGDALVAAAAAASGFDAERFAEHHPGGHLGRLLTTRVREAMHPGTEAALVSPGDLLSRVAALMTEHPLGAACVVDADGRLAGLITDGDLRRALDRADDIRALTAADVMTREPITISPAATLHEALDRMENRPSQIAVLPVVEPETGRWLGLVRIHDLYARG